MYVVFFRELRRALYRASSCYSKAESKGSKMVLSGVKNKYEVRNWEVTGKNEVELITSGLVNTAQGVVNC